MPFEEKSTWVAFFTHLAAGIWYLTEILRKTSSTPVAEVEYIGELAVMILASVAITVVAMIAVAIFAAGQAVLHGDLSGDVDKTDERDKSISRFAGNIGGYVLAVGMVPAMGLAVFEFDHFWIAHAILASFFASELITGAIKLVAYRRGF
ncbi:MAG: hypothetical protein ACFCVC_02380 [Acidimicrobiia bacterium]